MSLKEEAQASLAALKRAMRKDSQGLSHIRTVSGYMTELRRRRSQEVKKLGREEERREAVLRKMGSLLDDLAAMKKERDAALAESKRVSAKLAKAELDLAKAKSEIGELSKGKDDRFESFKSWAGAKCLEPDQAYALALMEHVKECMPTAPSPTHTFGQYYVFDYSDIFTAVGLGSDTRFEALGLFISLMACSGISIAVTTYTNAWLGDDVYCKAHPDVEKFRKWAAPILKNCEKVRSYDPILEASRLKPVKTIRKGPLGHIV